MIHHLIHKMFFLLLVLLPGQYITVVYPPPVGTAASDRNYVFFNANNSTLSNTTVTLYASKALVALNNSWSLQLNAYAPAPYSTAWMQFIINIEPRTGFEWSIEYWNTSAKSMFCQCFNTFPRLVGQTTLPQGWQLMIGLLTRSGDNSIYAVGFDIRAANGTLVGIAGQYLSQVYGWRSSYYAPMVAFEANIVGGSTHYIANFTSGTGFLSYQFANQPPPLPNQNDTQAPPVAETWYFLTGEMSNMSYGLPYRPSPGWTVMQTFNNTYGA